MSKPMVYLVGAGPGDYKLITVKGLEYIKKADAIIYDRLADSRLLSYAKPDVELVYVGKASSNHAMRQEDINQLLVDKALEGKCVVRLKGGDPFVFGRGGEEALHLLANGVPFEVVPGITSAISVPAYAGIPVTHRGIATSFAVVTGHEDPTKGESTIHWDKLAGGVDTLVFLMGVENLPYITAKLMEHGRKSDTPAAVIRWGTRPDQETLITTLGEAASDVAAKGITPPAIFLVGEVASLRQDLAWFDKRPLHGKKMLVTRSREQASALTSELEALGAQCIEAPAITIKPMEDFSRIDQAINELAAYTWLIFTSVNGVDQFFGRLKVLGHDARKLGNVKVAAIGSATAEALEARGVLADIIPVEFRAEGIVEALAGEIKPGMRVLIPRAAVARDVLPEKLTEYGAAVDVVAVYTTQTADTDGQELCDMLANGEIDLVTFTSSSTVTNLLKLLGDNGPALLSGVTAACIGPITAQTCLEHDIQPAVIAEEFTIKGLVKAIVDLYGRN